jgi:transposase InsO family protein
VVGARDRGPHGLLSVDDLSAPRRRRDVEFATLTYVDWFNQRRLHGEIEPGPGYTTPAAFQTAYYRQSNPTEEAGTQTSVLEG